MNTNLSKEVGLEFNAKQNKHDDQPSNKHIRRVNWLSSDYLSLKQIIRGLKLRNYRDKIADSTWYSSVSTANTRKSAIHKCFSCLTMCISTRLKVKI